MTEVKQLLLSKYSEEELASAVEQKKTEYSGLITNEGALKIIARENNVPLPVPEVVYGSLDDVSPGQQVNVELVFDKLYAEKSFESKGRKGRLCSVDVSNNGRKARLVLWNQDVSFLKKKGVEKNAVVKAQRLLVKTLAPLELHSVMSTKLELEKEGFEETKLLSDVKEGDTASFACSLIEKSVLYEFERDGRKSAVLNAVVSDSSGTKKLVCWGDNAFKVQKFVLGQQFKVEDAVLKNDELHCGWSTHLVVNPVQETVIKTKKLFEVEAGFEGLVEAMVKEVSEPKLSEKNALYVNALLTDDKMRLPCVFFNEDAKAFLGIKDSQLDVKTLFDLKKDSFIGKKIAFRAIAKNNSLSGETELVCRSFVKFVD